MKAYELALWATVGTLLNAVGYAWESWQFWCFLATYWAVHHIGKITGTTNGIQTFIRMPESEQKKIRELLKEAEK